MLYYTIIILWPHDGNCQCQVYTDMCGRPIQLACNPHKSGSDSCIHLAFAFVYSQSSKAAHHGPWTLKDRHRPRELVTRLGNRLARNRWKKNTVGKKNTITESLSTRHVRAQIIHIRFPSAQSEVIIVWVYIGI